MVNGNAKDSIEYLIMLASAGAQGVSIQISDLNWAAIMSFANTHNVLPLIACAVKESPDLDCPEQIRGYLMNVMRTTASLNMIRRQRIMHLIREMQSAGIPVRLLKG